MRKGCAGRLEIAILPQFLAIELHFMRKGCAGQVKIAILPQFFAIEPHFVRKGCAGEVEIAILPQFLAIEPHSCERVAFRAVPLALPLPSHSEEKWKRRRGQEGKRARRQEEKM